MGRIAGSVPLAAPISDAYDAVAAKSHERLAERRRVRQDCPYGSQPDNAFLIVRFAGSLLAACAAPYLLLFAIDHVDWRNDQIIQLIPWTKTNQRRPGV